MARTASRKPVRKPAGKKAAAAAPKPATRKSSSSARRRPRTEITPRSRPEPRGLAFPVEVDPHRLEETLTRIRSEVQHWANKGRYTRVRFKFRGKQLLPDLPFAAVMAVEGLTFYWSGILRSLIFNIAGKAVFDVELVNDSEKRVQQGRAAVLSGDLDKALSLFVEAIDMQRDNATAHLNLGIVYKLKGQYSAAKTSLEKARTLDDNGPVSLEAEKILATLPTGETSVNAAIREPSSPPWRSTS